MAASVAFYTRFLRAEVVDGITDERADLDLVTAVLRKHRPWADAFATTLPPLAAGLLLLQPGSRLPVLVWVVLRGMEGRAELADLAVMRGAERVQAAMKR